MDMRGDVAGPVNQQVRIVFGKCQNGYTAGHDGSTKSNEGEDWMNLRARRIA